MTATSVWFRFYNNVAHDPKVQRLSGDKFKAWVNMLCLASENGGILPNVADLSYALRMPEEAVSDLLNEFYRLILLDEIEVDGGPMAYTPHNWSSRQFKSDVSTERVKRFRETKRNVSPPKTETLITEQNRTEQSKAVRSATPPNEDFLTLKKVYPKRAGNYAWKAAERKFNSLVKTGVDPQAIIAAAKRLGVTLKSRIGTEFIPMPPSWLNSEDFVECAVQAFDAPQATDWDAVCSQFKRFGSWSKHAPGPGPESPACQCPRDVLDKHGILYAAMVDPPPAPLLRAM